MEKLSTRLNPKVLVFDIDGTVCTDTDGNYALANPYLDRIRIINKLYEEGVKIIFMTARGMDSCGGDQFKACAKYYEFTYKQLNKWDVKFHQLYFGKPKADFYIDDKGLDLNFFKNCFVE